MSNLAVVGAVAGLGYVERLRKIPQFNGTGMYATFNTNPVLTSGDKIRFKFSNLVADGTENTLFGVTGATTILTQDAAGNFAITGNFTATLDGVAIASGVTTVPVDGDVHTIECTFTGAGAINQIAALVGTRFWQGPLWDFEIEDNSGAIPVITKYALSSGSDLYELPVGETLDAEKYTGQLQDDSVWRLDAYATVGGGELTFSKSTNGLSYESIKPEGLTALAQDELCLIEFDISEYSNTGTAPDGGRIYLGYDASQAITYANGHYALLISASDVTTEDYFYIESPSVLNGTVSFTVTNLTIKNAANALQYINFSTDSIDWPSYRWNAATQNWDWRGSLVAGSSLVELEGTATTPTSFAITTVTGTAIQLNPEGLLVQTSLTYTYATAPDGENIYLDFIDVDSLTAFNISGMYLTSQSVDNLLCAIAASVTRSSRAVTVDLTLNAIPSATGLACKAVIEAEGGTVSVDS